MRRLIVAALFSAAPLLIAQGPIHFEPIQPDLMGAGGAFVNAWADVDGNSRPDVFVGFNGDRPNRLYLNEPGEFREAGDAFGLATTRAVRAAAWADVDRDGDADLLVGFTPGATSLLTLYRNDGTRFTDFTEASGLATMTGAVRQLAFVDDDGDGDLDLFVAFRDKPNAFFRHEGARFLEVAANLGLADPRKSVGAVWFDYDQDGDLDLYVASMDGDANGLFQNTGHGFTDVAEAAGVAWGGRTPGLATNGTVRPCVADVNGDGRFDLFLANYGKNGLFLAKPDGTFEDVSRAWGVDTEGRFDTCLFGDVDLDGRVDLYVNGTITGGTQYPDYLFRNAGTRFDDVTPAEIRAVNADHGAAFVDVDLDGLLDLALTGSQPNGTHAIFRNQGTSTAWRGAILPISPRGTAMPGAEVRVYRAGTRRLLVSGLMDSGSGYNMQNVLPAVIAADTDRRVDVEITWPARGQRWVMRHPNFLLVKARALPLRIPVPALDHEALFEAVFGGPVPEDAQLAALGPETVSALRAARRRLAEFKTSRTGRPPANRSIAQARFDGQVWLEQRVIGAGGTRAAAAAIADKVELAYEWEGFAEPPLNEAYGAERYLEAHPKSAGANFLHLFAAQRTFCALEAEFDPLTGDQRAARQRAAQAHLDAVVAANDALLSPLAAFVKADQICHLR